MKPKQSQGPKLRFVDRPEVVETFADSTGSATFDGQTLRLELLVTRVDEMKEGQTQVTGTQRPVVRLVLTPAAVQQLYNDLTNMMQAIQTAQAPAPEGRMN